MLARTIFRTATHLRRPISTPIIITPHQCYFSTLKKYKQSQKLHRGPQSPNISSLHSDCTANIYHRTVTVIQTLPLLNLNIPLIKKLNIKIIHISLILIDRIQSKLSIIHKFTNVYKK